MKTIKFYTLGCKVNQYDTQDMREQILRTGLKEIYNGVKADIYLINTCTVTHKADNDSLGLIRRARRENPKAKIIVAGCLAELDADKIREIEPTVVIVKNEEKENLLPGIVLDSAPRSNNNRIFFERATEGSESRSRGISYFQGHTRAFLKIQDGCNNFCSYCRLPFARGHSRSKPLEEIIQEAERLVDNSIKEIVLAGVCLGAYGADLRPKIDIADVVGALEKIKKLWRIRLSSIEASDISDKLIEKIASSKKLCRHLHIPIQSGDDSILKRMNRKYCRKDYLALIRKIKKSIPGIAITTDILVGFPGETEVHFRNTVDLVKKIQPLKVHIFPYSRRQGTAAFSLGNQATGQDIKSRISRLRKVTEDCSLSYRREFLRKKVQVLIEARVKENLAFWEGHSDNYMLVRIASKRSLKNRIIPLKIKKIDRGFAYADFSLL